MPDTVKQFSKNSRNEPNVPFGAKEVGESAIPKGIFDMPTIPTILNAIYDAKGVYVEDAGEMLKAIKKKRSADNFVASSRCHVYHRIEHDKVFSTKGIAICLLNPKKY